MNTHIYSPSSARTTHRPESDMYTPNNVGLRFGITLKPRPINLNLSPEDMPARPPNSRQSPHKSPHPVLRWFGQSSDKTATQTPESRPLSRSATPLQNL